MCYKDELQEKNWETLQRALDKDGAPAFIRRYFILCKSKATAKNYWSTIRDLLTWAIVNKSIPKDSISEITPEDMLYIEAPEINLYLDYKVSHDGMALTTIETKKNALRSFWKYLVETNQCPVSNNVIGSVTYDGIKSSIYNNSIKKCPKDEEIKAMEERIRAKKDPFLRERNLLVLRVLKGTGVREGELAGLDLQDVDFVGDEWGGAYILVLGKGSYRKENKRKVYLTKDAQNAIQEWLEIRKKKKHIIDKDALFLNKNGKRLTESNIQAIFKVYGNGLTPHMLRHWYATIIANQDGGSLAAQQQLGHHSILTTRQNYINNTYRMRDILDAI